MGLTVLRAWQLHLLCSEALAANTAQRHVHALAAVRDALGAELTRILSPEADAEEDSAELESEKGESGDG